MTAASPPHVAALQSGLQAAAVSPEQLRATLPGRLADHARRHPQRVALRHKRLGIWEPIDWGTYYAEVVAAARQLHDLGLGAGDHVAILSDNRPEWLIADLAAQAVGARGVGIYQTNPAADVAFILRHSGCRLLVCEDQEQVDKAMAVVAETPDLQHIVVLDPRGTQDYDDPRLVSWQDFIGRGRELATTAPDWFPAQLASLDPRAPSMVVYTSGTTGEPKGAMLSSWNALAPAEATVAELGLGDEEIVLSYLPLCHVAEKIFSLFLPMVTGAVVHFGESIDTVQEDLREVSPTIFLGVPRIWEKMHAGIHVRMQDASPLKRRLYDWAVAQGRRVAERRRRGEAGPADAWRWALADLLIFRPLQERLGLRRCRFPISGAAPVAAELLTWYHSVGIEILEGFGQTECAGVSHINRPGRARIGTVGQVLPAVECRLDDDGEILVRGPNVFVGYLHDSEATARTIDTDGWLHTGDIGQVSADGYLSITGRKKEILITAGGKNLSPEKIENALKTSAYIKEAVAIGDARKFVAALVQIERDTVGDWATRRRIPFTSFEDLAANPEVHKLIAEQIELANEQLARVEQVRAFRLLPRELQQDDGELTATQKIRRKVVFENHSALIEEMYR